MSAPAPHTVSAEALRPFRAAQARLAHPLAALELTCAQADGIVALLALDLAAFDARPLGALPAVAPAAPRAAAGGRESRPGRRRWPVRESRVPGSRPGVGGARAAAVERAWRGDLREAGEGVRDAFGGPARGEGARLAAHDRAEAAPRAADDPAPHAGTDRAASGARDGAGAASGAHDFAAAGAMAAAPGASGPTDTATLAAAAEAAFTAARPVRVDAAAGPTGRAAPRALAGRERVAEAIGASSDAAVEELGGGRPAAPDRAALGPPEAALLADRAGTALVRPAAPSALPDVAPAPAAAVRTPALAAAAAGRANGVPAASAPPAALTSSEHAWLVNEALVEQARRHGVDLS